MIIDGCVRLYGQLYDASNLMLHIEKENIDKALLFNGFGNSSRKFLFNKKGNKKPKKDINLKQSKRMKQLLLLEKAAKNIQSANEQLRIVHKEIGYQVIPFYTVDTTQRNFFEITQADYKEWKFGGLHINQCIFSSDLLQLEMLELYKWAGENKLPVMLLPSSKTDIYSIQKAIRDFQGTTFIVQHLIGLELFEDCMINQGNFYFDISPLHTISDLRLGTAIKKFTSRKLIYGSGLPNAKHSNQENIQRLSKLVNDEFEVKLITNDNLKRILN